MSRSVKQGYIYSRQGTNVVLLGTVSEEQLFEAIGQNDMRFHRKDVGHNVSPTNEDWAKYHRAKAGLLALQNYENVLGLEEVEVRMPTPHIEYTFTETNEEWLDRCRSLQAERKAA